VTQQDDGVVRVEVSTARMGSDGRLREMRGEGVMVTRSRNSEHDDS
jgi:hypothetical protein